MNVPPDIADDEQPEYHSWRVSPWRAVAAQHARGSQMKDRLNTSGMGERVIVEQ